jgi:fatty acid desaturase/1-acyl-sn-glycerol-3-phosphate acyltransferase
MVCRSRISRPLAIVLRPIHRAFMPAYFRIALRHPERLPRAGPLILAPSHRSKWDSLVLSHLTGGPLRYLAAHEEFVGVQGWFMRRLGAFPINTSVPTPGPIRHALDLVAAGVPLVVFPEGTIFYSRPGEVHPLRRGAAWLGLKAQDRCPGTPVWIVPIRLNYGDRFLRFRSRIEIVVQEPITVSPYLSYPRKEGTRMLTADLQKSLGDVVNTSQEERYPAVGLRARTRAREAPATADARAWFRTLDPERRAAIRTLHGLRPAWNVVLLFYPALWLVAANVALANPSWPLRLACYAVIGVAIHALATLMHEGIHGTLFRRRQLDRWFGFLLGAPALFSFTAYRVAHLVHHRHTRTPRDPDDFLNVSSSRLVRSAVFYGWLAVGMLAYLLHVPLRALRLATPRERRAILAEYAAITGIAAAIVLGFGRFGRLDIVLHGWLLPLSVAIVFGNVRSWAEHALTRPGHPLTQTRTVTSNRVVSFLMCNLNYHLEHHLFPGVPWYRLPRLHALLSDEYQRAGAIVHRSYLGFLWEAGRAGVHGTTSGRVTRDS